MSNTIEATASIDIGKNLTQLMEKLAQQLGTTVDKIFPWYVKQQEIWGYSFLFICVFCFIISAGMLKYSSKKIDWDNVTVPNFLYILGCGGIIIISFVFICGFSTMTSCIFNPQYEALRSLMSDMSHLLHG